MKEELEYKMQKNLRENDQERSKQKRNETEEERHITKTTNKETYHNMLPNL